jgi:hypothetical protein
MSARRLRPWSEATRIGTFVLAIRGSMGALLYSREWQAVKADGSRLRERRRPAATTAAAS